MMQDLANVGAPIPTILPLGDSALIVRFGTSLEDSANLAAVAAASVLGHAGLLGVAEVVPNLVSVLLRYEPRATTFDALAGEVRLALSAELDGSEADEVAIRRIAIRFGGEDGPDLEEAAATLGMATEAFVAAHNAAPLRVLATGFAPGFVYCGFHPAELELPRRTVVRRSVPAGTVLFAARQTAITATTIPTGWHVIGRTEFRNFDPAIDPPTRLHAGDHVAFEAAS